MSSTSTPRLGLFKAVPGTAEPFRTTDINSNMDKIDAEAVAFDTRLDAAESSVTGFDTRLDAAESDIDALQIAVAAGAVTTVSGTTYSTLATDNGDYIRFTSTSAVTVTIDNNLTVGQYINFVQDGTGAVSFTPGTGVTLNSVSNNRKLSAQYAWASVICVASGSYRLVGSLIA